MFSEEFGHIFAHGGLNVYDNNLSFQDFMFIIDEDKPVPSCKEMNLKDLKVHQV